MKLLLSTTLALLACTLLAGPADAQIRSLTLPEMVEMSDDAVHGQILSKRVTRVDTDSGRAFYMTTMTIEGRLLSNGTAVRVDVTYPGGFVNEEEGYWHSESPGAQETKVGNTIVAFYGWTEPMDGIHGANWLSANHGGLYQAAAGPKGSMVLGRGPGYAVAKNLRATDLEASYRAIRKEQAQRRKR